MSLPKTLTPSGGNAMPLVDNSGETLAFPARLVEDLNRFFFRDS